MIVGLKDSIPYVIKSSREIQLMLPGLKTNYLNVLMFCINMILMSVQLFVIIISLFYQSLKNPQSEIHSHNAIILERYYAQVQV